MTPQNSRQDVMKPEPRKTRVYAESAKTDFLVYGLILSIAIFFASAGVAYFARFILFKPSGQLAEIPPILWISTAILLTGGHLLRRALHFIRREKQRQFINNLTWAFSFSLLFCLVQTYGLTQLLAQHGQLPQENATGIASAFLLILLHTCHFLVGVITLGYVLYHAKQGRYDHEYYNGVKLSAVYWRFLDIVWLMMLAMFWLSTQ